MNCNFNHSKVKNFIPFILAYIVLIFVLSIYIYIYICNKSDVSDAF